MTTNLNLSEKLQDKYQELWVNLKEKGSAVVAFSGGVDSTLLLKVTKDVLKNDVLAVTSASETIPTRELEHAKELAAKIGVSHEIIYTNELKKEGFRKNSPNRCFYCKQELFTELWKIAAREGYSHVLDGSNYDDSGDFRPGLEAASQLQVTSPLKEAGFTKQDVRDLSKELGLITWKKPAKACLSSRFPYGEELSADKIKQVERGEDVLDELGFSQYRLRYHGEVARLELSLDELQLAIDSREKIITELKELGFKYITLDLDGYRTGSMNETL
ncbi:ATP-dependent sacrificial sulfur transferase LarE [Natranaerobius trueperi]|uniref:TIGR00268 family protein n=1 Tax=Natranaerobius trueperi TaxID=759412 RepID=A0A226C029_9FIRM|nr:ATP-dependent sacrificial sulfur transferase LarE [Natranaerobius trueperi]OWZ84586.1 TIGR00268 family protein [Natranaerobius trueperi]